MAADAVAILLRLIAILQDLDLRYVVGGSLASSLHGEPRATHDVDVLIDLPPAQLVSLLSRVAGEFYVSEAAAQRAVDTCTSFNLVHLVTGHKVDLFVAGPSPLDVLQLESSQSIPLAEGSHSVRVTSAAVLVLRKLAWYRSGNEASERQWRDVVGILKVQGTDLPLDDIRDLAAELDLTELLDRAVREAGSLQDE